MNGIWNNPLNLRCFQKISSMWKTEDNIKNGRNRKTEFRATLFCTFFTNPRVHETDYIMQKEILNALSRSKITAFLKYPNFLGHLVF